MTRGVLPYKGTIGTCGQPRYVFGDFCLLLINHYCLGFGLNVLNRVSKVAILS